MDLNVKCIFHFLVFETEQLYADCVYFSYLIIHLCSIVTTRLLIVLYVIAMGKGMASDELHGENNAVLAIFGSHRSQLLHCRE